MRKGNKLWAVFLAVCMILSVLPSNYIKAAESAKKDDTKIIGLTTEYMKNPIGIDTGRIRFGWKMESQKIGTMQSAYQVKVYKENGDLAWDSGKVKDDKSSGISCEDQLEEGSIYTWEVTVWDNNGNPYSNMASFETGVTNLEAWKQAEFIRMNKSEFAPVFRTEQSLTGTDIKKARLYITALGAYQAYVNGNRVGEYDGNGKITYQHMNPGYGNKDVSLGYQTYDITSFVQEDSSVAVAVEAGTGWYNGMGNTGASQPAVKALVLIDYADGSQQQIKTNTDDWKGTLAGGITKNGVYYGEDYNAVFAEELGDYTQNGYNDDAWIDGKNSAAHSLPHIENEFDSQTASYVRLLVNETGPANASKENFLQIMELELLDSNNTNVAAGYVPEISNSWSPNKQWSPSYLTDGDYGNETDNGYTSTLLGKNGDASYKLTEPISIVFKFDSQKSFDALRIYPRTSIASVSGNECSNYPKEYKLQISEDGKNWTDVDLDKTSEDTSYTVESLRNTELYPETGAVSYGTDFDHTIVTKNIKIDVTKIGPAVADDNENRLQLMELELLSGNKNVIAGETPVLSSSITSGTQWRAANLTDGDYGVESDSGITTDVLGYGKTELELDTPVSIIFDLDHEISFSELKLYPRVTKNSISNGICPNYPQVYTVSISEDGKNWTEVATNTYDLLRDTTKLQNMELSATTYDGEIRAQVGTPGRMIDTLDRYPVDAHTYSGTKANSSYAGGEIEIDAEYSGSDMFENGLELRKGQTIVVNMGQNLTAVPNIKFSGKKGAKATLRFAEMLNDGSAVGNGATQADGPKGSIYQKSLRGARSQATYIFAGNEVEVYQPKMSFFGYQYVEVTATDDITIYGIVSKAISSVSKQTGNIETNNENVNKLFNNVLYGQLSNYYTTPTDCNQRDERLSWTGDTQAFAQTAVYNFDSYAFLNEVQDVYAEIQKITGYVPSVTDQSGSFFGNWAAGWSDVLIILPWTLYLQTGDRNMLEDNWEVMDSYMTYLHERERAADQSWIPDNSRNYGDWLSFQGTSVEVIYDYYYGYMHQMMAKIAEILGKEEQTVYEEKAEAIKTKFIATHVTFENGNLTIKSGEGNKNYQFMYSAGKGGVWENNSQTALLWMLKTGFYDSEEMKEAAQKLLIENIKNENPDSTSVRAKYGENTLAVGFLGANVLTPVLSEIGSSDVAYDLLLQDGQPSWLFEVKAGATTIWERWNSYSPGVGFGDSEMNSFNHYAYGAVVEWMYRYMAGIENDIENPGFKNIILQPTLDTGSQYNEEERINSVNASYDSCYGSIESAWTVDKNGKLSTYHTKVPANTTATLYLPVDKATADQYNDIAGVQVEGFVDHNGQTVLKMQLSSGGYDFKVADHKISITYSEEYKDNNNQEDAGGNTETGGNENSGGNTQTGGGSTDNGSGNTDTGSGTTNTGNGTTSGAISDTEQAQKEQAQAGTTAVEESQKTITSANTDNGDVAGSKFAVLKLKAKEGNKSVKLSWKKVKGADGYIIYGAPCGKKMEQIKELTASKKSYTVKKLKKGKYYKYMVVAYKNIYGEKRVIETSVSVHIATKGGKYGNPTAVVFEKKTVSVKKNKTFKLKPELKYDKKIKTHIAKFRYESSNPSIAAVNKSGKIKGKKKGKCDIYIYAQNGLYKKIKVTVK